MGLQDSSTAVETFHSSHPHAGVNSSHMFWWAVPGGTLFVAGLLAKYVYSDNPLASDISTALGAALLAAPALFRAVHDMVRGEMHLNAQIAIALLASMSLGEFVTTGAIALFTFFAIIIEGRSSEGAHIAIERLMRLAPKTATRVGEDGKDEQVNVNTLAVGDCIRLLPGASIPVDGVIRTGCTTVDESSVTGESLPRYKDTGAEVFAGTQNVTGAIEITATEVGDDTTLGKIRELILSAEKTKLPVTQLLDHYIHFYTPVTLGAAGTLLFFTGEWGRAIALLVIACPCALILSTPAAMIAALSAAARLGILIKQVGALQFASDVDTVVMDKTGTLTTGQLSVSRVRPAAGFTTAELLSVAASVGRFSIHPAAVAIAHFAERQETPMVEVGRVLEESGMGLQGRIGKESVLMGRLAWLQEHGVIVSQQEREVLRAERGYSMTHVGHGTQYLGWIGLSDQLRPSAERCVRELHGLGVGRVAMMTGDNDVVAERVARAIRCDEFRSNCLPGEKAAFVKSLARKGYHVAVVGDGVNDAPALSAGHIGIAMGAAGSDVALASSSIVLMNNELERIPFLIRLSEVARSIVYQNISIATAIIIGGGLVAGCGHLSPAAAAMLHFSGTVLVALNGARMLRLGEELGDVQLDHHLH